MSITAWAAFVVHFWLAGLLSSFIEQQNESFHVGLLYLKVALLPIGPYNFLHLLCPSDTLWLTLENSLCILEPFFTGEKLFYSRHEWLY